MHPRISVHHVCFPKASLSEFADQCRSLGVGRVSLASPWLLAEGAEAEIARAFGRANLAVETVNHPFAVYPNLEGDKAKAQELMARAISVAADLGAKSLYCLTGGRGSLEWEQAAKRFAEWIAPGVALAKSRGLALMIENAPMQYADIHIAHSLADTITLATQATIGVCVETFFCWAEAGLPTLLGRAMPLCSLVQISDYVLGDRSLPARAVPGDGCIPIETIVTQILESGYEGAFDLELIGPRIDAEGHYEAVARAGDYLSALLTRLGV